MIQKLKARQQVRRGRAPGAGPIPAPPWRRAVLPGAAFLAGLVSSLSTALGQTSFIGAGAPDMASDMYEYIIEQAKTYCPRVERGEFGADMKVSLTNDGPFTIVLNSKDL